ncbi:glycosyltransferase family 4 protein [Curtobacterium sp. S6]|uniref:glycosyltransferase family 4 protein n=1 Tax=Curtobacterium sp. S6 TaxID=1479623 RepID=UPI00068D452F|nr:glycosyltransferase family 1 protein [Curtobacterium sp. S6]
MVAESFVPHLSGVTTSLLRSAENLRRRGHEVMFLAPSGRGFTPSDWSPTILPSLPRVGPAEDVQASRPAPATCPVTLAPGQTYEEVEGTPTIRMPSLPLAGYPTLRFSMGTVTAVRRIMAEYRPDVVHIASPFVLGARAVTAAHALGIPSVAVYQTDVAAYTHRYGMPWLKAYANKRIASIHTTATMTLAPSHSSMDYLDSLAIPRVFKWGRGVDTELFHPGRRSERVRQSLGVAEGQLAVGFVGRLASEKQVEDLRVVQSLPGVRLVIIGAGPERARLGATLHQAVFTGQLTGTDLAEHVASLDVFVHPGEFETFGQTLQEAMASGVATVAVGKGGPLDIIDDGVTGRLYEPGQLGMLRAIVASLRDHEVRGELGEKGRRAMEARSWGAASLKLEGYYDRATEFHRSRQLRRWRGAPRRGAASAASRHRV